MTILFSWPHKFICALPHLLRPNLHAGGLEDRDKGARNETAEACIRTATNEEWRVSGSFAQAQLEFLGLMNSGA